MEIERVSMDGFKIKAIQLADDILDLAKVLQKMVNKINYIKKI